MQSGSSRRFRKRSQHAFAIFVSRIGAEVENELSLNRYKRRESPLRFVQRKGLEWIIQTVQDNAEIPIFFENSARLVEGRPGNTRHARSMPQSMANPTLQNLTKYRGPQFRQLAARSAHCNHVMTGDHDRFALDLSLDHRRIHRGAVIA